MNNIRRLLFFANANIINYKNEYFTIEALEDGLTAKLSTNACEYRIDNGVWTTLSANTNTQSINKGQTLSFRGNLTPTSSSGIGTFTISNTCNIKGNIMSLLYGNDFVGKIDLIGKNYAFYKLFYNCSKIIDASNLILPATTLASYCYRYMFYKCTGLTAAPKLPATTLVNECYEYMFHNCTSLATAPELPATELASSCYSSMFQGCTSLTTAPELPATTLANYCYQSMFSDCTNLATAPELPATTLADYCYNNMFSYCSSLTNTPELPATTLADYCYKNMFYKCTGLTTAPELPATTLADGCYSGMFSYWTSLTTAPELPATTLAEHCYRQMFQSCTSLNNITMLATNISASSCLYNWVSGVSSKGTFIKHPDMNSLPTGTSGIPSGWTVENNI